MHFPKTSCCDRQTDKQTDGRTFFSNKALFGGYLHSAEGYTYELYIKMMVYSSSILNVQDLVSTPILSKVTAQKPSIFGVLARIKVAKAQTLTSLGIILFEKTKNAKKTFSAMLQKR